VIAATPDDRPALEQLIKAQAYGLGFDLVGIATLGIPDTAEAFDSWLARGYAGEMDYMKRGAVKRRDTRLPFPGATSAIVVALNYDGTSAAGPIARYARGDDYHDVMEEMLGSLRNYIESHIMRPVRGKAYVDTGPILERDLARKAGLGWFGKNTNLINPRLGSFFFIGSLLVELDLEADRPFESDHCGTCTRCLDACPTDAFAAPGVLNATRCISYLTIEARGAIPEEFRAAMGTLAYGCDICQSVCPWNTRFAQSLTVSELAPRPGTAGKDARELARELLAMDDEQFRAAFKGSPMKRAKRRGLARNAAVVLGNTGDKSDAPLLTAALDDPEPIVREHAAWALARIERLAGSSDSMESLG